MNLTKLLLGGKIDPLTLAGVSFFYKPDRRDPMSTFSNGTQMFGTTNTAILRENLGVGDSMGNYNMIYSHHNRGLGRMDLMYGGKRLDRW